jgi:hypothetical protein
MNKALLIPVILGTLAILFVCGANNNLTAQMAQQSPSNNTVSVPGAKVQVDAIADAKQWSAIKAGFQGLSANVSAAIADFSEGDIAVAVVPDPIKRLDGEVAEQLAFGNKTLTLVTTTLDDSRVHYDLLVN